MAGERSEFDRLMGGVRAGDQDAARALYARYGQHVLRVVRRKLAMRLRAQYDSEDFLQSVMASFFAIPEGTTFDGPEQLIDFLATMAHNKVADAARRRLGTKKHNLNRETSLDSGGPPVAAPGATPSQEVIANERWEQLVQTTPPALREVLLLRREGLTYEEISARTGLHVKAIQRRLDRLKRGQS